MSLQVEAGRRGRSRSPGGRDRSRSRGPALVIDVNPAPAPVYDYDDRYSSYRSPTSPRDDYYSHHQYSRSPVTENGPRTSHGDLRPAEREHLYQRDSPRLDRHSDSDREQQQQQQQRRTAGGGFNLAEAFLPQKYAHKLETSDAYNLITSPLSDRARERSRDRRAEKKDRLTEDLAYGKLPRDMMRPISPAPLLSPTSPSYEYASALSSSQFQYPPPPPSVPHRNTFPAAEPKRSSGADLLGVDDRSGRGRSRSKSPGGWREHSRDGRDDSKREHSRDDRNGKRDHSRDDRDRHRDHSRGDTHRKRDHSRDDRERKHSHRDSLDPRASGASLLTADAAEAPRKSALKRSSSPQPPVNKLAGMSLSVDTLSAANTEYNKGVSAAPPSPLLEAYHGTYQSMSPMPSPVLQASYRFDGPNIQDVSPLHSDSDDANGHNGTGKKQRARRARFADPKDDASRLKAALEGDRPPDIEPLIEILPGLTHEQVMELRVQYKKQVPTGPRGKGINVAKHIRARLKDADPALMKACYATALGRWESEAYWSSFWYQGDKTRRELLIESLMGRTNAEIGAIKEAFMDKTYDNSITRMMRHELKEDKFKKAVLMVLDEERMEDEDRHGRELPIDQNLVEDDVYDLRKAIKAEKGGESALINIVVKRSDNHLRETMKLYNEKYQANFARDALYKSQNLVGELLAHILNGVINKPVRDALLVHHALTATKRDNLRRELLTSRLVRYHWDGKHMVEVKKAYQKRYGKDMHEAVQDATAGEWGQFCSELCITRMPDEVQRFKV